jgi:tetratricopeptide (TPR) repeat protein
MNTDKYYNKGMEQLKNREFKCYRNGLEIGAIVSFESSINWYNKDNDKCYYLMGVTSYYIYLSQMTAGITDRERTEHSLKDMCKYLEKAIELNQKYPEAHYYKGMYYYEKNQYKKAIEEFNLAGDCGKLEKEKSDKWCKASEVMIKECNNLLKGKSNKDTLKVITPLIDGLNENFLLLDERDILDWPKFLENLITHYNILEGKIWILLDEKVKKEFTGYKKGEDFTGKKLLIENINKILKRRDLYDPLVLKDMSKSKEIKGYIKKGIDKLCEPQVRKFNRLLLESVYSEHIIKRSKDIIKSDQIYPPLPEELDNIK